jgi:hypothetical protein
VGAAATGAWATKRLPGGAYAAWLRCSSPRVPLCGEYRDVVSSLRSELEERRTYACRLAPDRALESLAEAEAFVRER